MPVIVDSVPATAELLVSAVPGARVVATLEEFKRLAASDDQEYAVVLGPHVDLEAAAALADAYRITRPATSVILVRRRVDTAVLSEALRSGMREVVDERDLPDLTAAVERARQVREAIFGPGMNAPAQDGKVITIFSPKGGVGKTTLAVNLGIALAEGGTKRVCLVDLDLGFGDVAITLQVFPSHTIADAVPMGQGLDASSVGTLLTAHQDGVQVLAAPVQPDAKETISASLVARVLQVLRSSFDYVVVDSSPGFDEQVLQAFDETDECVLVATLDVPTLKNVKIALETLDLLNVAPGRRRLVLNRADEKVGLSTEKVESILGMPIDTAIPTSVQVASATNAGHPIVSAMPRHPVSQAIATLAGDLAAGSVPHADGPEPVGAGGPRRRGFLRSRRSA